MIKSDFCLCENKGADQRLCFHNTDSSIPLLSKSGISSLKPSSVLDTSVCVGLGRKPLRTDFLRVMAQTIET